MKRTAAANAAHLDDWDANCHGFVNGVDWCQDPATWSPAMAGRAADLRSGAYARRLRDGLPEWPDELLDPPPTLRDADAPIVATLHYAGSSSTWRRKLVSTEAPDPS